MTLEMYHQALCLNDQVLKFIQAYQDTKDKNLLYAAFLKLTPVTRQEILKVTNKLCLNTRNYYEDMFQEAYLKLYSIVDWNTYLFERCPAFISFWRISLHNHLLSLFHQTIQTKRLTESGLDIIINNDPTCGITIKELKKIYFAEYTKPLVAVAVLKERIFKMPCHRTSQPELAARFGVTQGYISRWETWFQQSMRTLCGEL